MKRGLFILAAALLLMAQGPNTNRTFPSITGTGGIVGLGAASGQYVNAFVSVQGHAAPGDGDTGVFMWNSTSTATADGGTVFQASGVTTGRWLRAMVPGQPYNLSWFGAKCGGQQVGDGVSSVTGGLTHTITSATAAWTTAMVGWQIVVNGAASSGHQVVSTISTVTPPGSLTYAATTATAGTGLMVSVYPDDTTAFSNAVSGANAANAGLAFPAGKTCGVANPGSASSWNLTFPALYLNGATVWLGQTGPTSDTGWSFNMEGINTSGSQWSGVSVVGPGVVDGLYQNNQSVAQASILNGFVWNDGGGTTINNASVTGGVVIRNTKGVAIIAEGVNNFILDNVTVNNCGDLSYSHSSTPGDTTGKPMCVTIEDPVNSFQIRGVTISGAAQADLLLQNSGISGAANFLGNVSDLVLGSADYYPLDIEVFAGTLNLKNISVTNSIAPSGSFVAGGIAIRDVGNLNISNVVTYGIDSNALVIQATDGTVDTRDWNISNVSVIGTNANHAGQAYIAWEPNGASFPQHIDISGLNYDELIFQYSGPSCSSPEVQQQNVTFRGLKATMQQPGGSYATTFEPAGLTGQFTWIQGSDSYVGNVQLNSTGTNSNATMFDFIRVMMNATMAITGASVTAGYATNSLTAPQTAPSCP